VKSLTDYCIDIMNVLKFGNESYFFFDCIPEDADKDFCKSYFDREKILSHSEVETRGGRGKTLLPVFCSNRGKK